MSKRVKVLEVLPVIYGETQTGDKIELTNNDAEVFESKGRVKIIGEGKTPDILLTAKMRALIRSNKANKKQTI